jgi:hypothetical protein
MRNEGCSGCNVRTKYRTYPRPEVVEEGGVVSARLLRWQRKLQLVMCQNGLGFRKEKRREEVVGLWSSCRVESEEGLPGRPVFYEAVTFKPSFVRHCTD